MHMTRKYAKDRENCGGELSSYTIYLKKQQKSTEAEKTEVLFKIKTISIWIHICTV